MMNYAIVYDIIFSTKEKDELSITSVMFIVLFFFIFREGDSFNRIV